MHIKYRHPFMQQGGASISWEEHSEQGGGKHIVKLQLNKLKLAGVKQPTLKRQKKKSQILPSATSEKQAAFGGFVWI